MNCLMITMIFMDGTNNQFPYEKNFWIDLGIGDVANDLEMIGKLGREA